MRALLAAPGQCRRTCRRAETGNHEKDHYHQRGNRRVGHRYSRKCRRLRPYRSGNWSRHGRGGCRTPWCRCRRGDWRRRGRAGNSLLSPSPLLYRGRSPLLQRKRSAPLLLIPALLPANVLPAFSTFPSPATSAFCRGAAFEGFRRAHLVSARCTSMVELARIKTDQDATRGEVNCFGPNGNECLDLG